MKARWFKLWTKYNRTIKLNEQLLSKSTHNGAYSIKSLNENINKNKPWKKNQNVYVFQDCKKEKSTIEIQNS